jgi:hypothetical protein
MDREISVDQRGRGKSEQECPQLAINRALRLGDVVHRSVGGELPSS